MSSGISPDSNFAAYQAFSARVRSTCAHCDLPNAGIPMRIRYGRARLPCTSAVTKPASTCSEITCPLRA
ncbi:Uncharacterised protein [Mycobacterium tuberculosis]|nr:Uncharacterised protein [Mycobacterium tuberculosis]CKT68921.1 Uncharacterised protein [Mycobacterium tuberculosis]CNW32156.1 Uncharacterised protein [Mycobacterium tuberculosis]COW01937.1 Uncharacterised protein [Mycobacterium tuberculosis]COW16210.1 Uncharacterised protein [Mycobacterium tuberculosis]